MKQIGEYKLQFDSFEDLKYFIKDGISYYGDQYCMSDIETDEDWTLENIEDWFYSNDKDILENLTTYWTGICYSKQFYIPLGEEFYPHIGFYVGIRFEFYKYSDGSMYVEFTNTDNTDYIEQQTKYIFLDKDGNEYNNDIILNIIEESEIFKKEDKKVIQFIKNYYNDETCVNVQDEIKKLKEKYKDSEYIKK